MGTEGLRIRSVAEFRARYAETPVGERMLALVRGGGRLQEGWDRGFTAYVLAGQGGVAAALGPYGRALWVSRGAVEVSIEEDGRVFVEGERSAGFDPVWNGGHEGVCERIARELADERGLARRVERLYRGVFLGNGRAPEAPAAE